MVKLIVHIGHGKTGSSSIQESLARARTHLTEQGVRYLGLMLEYAGNTNRPQWQFRGGSDLFFDGIPADKASAELFVVLKDELQRLESQGVMTAIWSNEWLAPRANVVLPALRQLLSQNHDIEVQCYIRRHDKWIVSAYSQWGMKHKNYPGPVLPFKSWFSPHWKGMLNFSHALEPWEAVFSDRFKVFNFDESGDVVQHFLRTNGILGVESVLDNVSKDAPIAVAQAVFNSRKKSRVLPSEFDAVGSLASEGDENNATLPELDELYPSRDDISSILNAQSDDIERLNYFLDRSGEPRLCFDSMPSKFKHPSPWEMDQYLLKIIFGLCDENEKIKNRLDELERKIFALQAAREE